MQYTLRIVFLIIMLIYLTFIAKAVKKKNMRIGYLIFWIVIGIVMTIALVFPSLIENISKIIGFEVPINMIFSMAIFIVLYFIHDLTTLISKEENKNTALIQEISILKERVDKLEKREK